jgi:hypothetical protein
MDFQGNTLLTNSSFNPFFIQFFYQNGEHMAGKMKFAEREENVVPIQRIQVYIGEDLYTLFTRDLNASIKDLIRNRSTEGPVLMSGPDGRPITDMDRRRELARKYVEPLQTTAAKKGMMAGKEAAEQQAKMLAEVIPLLVKQPEKKYAEEMESREMVTKQFAAKNGTKYEVKIPLDDFLRLQSPNLARVVKMPGVRMYKLELNNDEKVVGRTLLSRREMEDLIKNEGQRTITVAPWSDG